jgi:mannose-6-phosphate isomerase-like protein (cupin superfamily)
MIPTLRPEAFVERHWGRRAGHFREPPERLGHVYDLENWRLGRYVGAVDAATRDASGRQRQIAIDLRQVSTLLAAGMTICADVSSEPKVANLLRELISELRIASDEPPFAKLYASPDGGGFAMHMDTHNVFVVQLQGTKTWWYGEEPALPWTLCSGKLDADGQPVTAGSRDGEPLVDDQGRRLPPPDRGALREVTLEPGDCLYLPPGTWHTTRAQGPSLAISVSPPRAPASRLLLDALEQRLVSSTQWRADLIGIPCDVADPAAVPPVVRDAITRRLRELGRVVLALEVREMQRSWCAAASRSAGSLHELTSSDDATPEREDRLAHAPGGFLHLVGFSSEMNGEAVLIYANGAEWMFPLQAQNFVRELGRHPTFVASDALSWDPALDWNAAREVLAQLLAAGILVAQG